MFDEWRATAPEAEDATAQAVSVPGRPAAFAGADVVDYRTTVSDPRETEAEIAVLELEGLYASASVEVPGSRLDGDGPVAHDTYFRPLRVPFVPDGDGEVRVRCRAPQDRFGGIHDTDLVPAAQAVPGIWWGARLYSRSVPYIESIDVRPTVTDEGAVLSLRTTVVSEGPLDERITYSVRPAGEHKGRGTMERARVESADGGRTVVEHTVEVRDPNLWWPRTLGEQHRYTIRGKLGDVETTVTTGICDVRRDGSELRVNGEPLQIRGVNLLTASTKDVDRALECNANLLRAHAHALPPELYERCDEVGMLVWQDLPLTGPGAFDTDRGEAVAAAIGNQYGRHPSLAAVGVHDDPADSFHDGLGSGFFDRLRLRYRAWRTAYDDEPARAVAEAVPVDRPVFPVIGGPGVDTSAGSYYPGWEYGEASSIASLLDRYPVDVVAEFGAGALGEEALGDGDDVAGFDAAIHEKRVADDIDGSQSYQSALLEEIVGVLRRERVGSIAFALRDTDRAGMGVFEHDGSPKEGANALARAYEPIRAYVADPDADESDLVVLNDRPRALSTELTYSVGDQEGTIDLTVNGQGRWRGGPISLPHEAESVRVALQVDGNRLQYDLSL